MSFTRHTCRALHEEHRAQLETLAKLEQAFSRRNVDRGEPTLALLRTLRVQITHDAERHFAFEEEQLFPWLSAAGDIGIVTMLSDEHATLRSLGAELTPRIEQAGAGSLDDPGWTELGQLALELAELQVLHIQKEEMALLPMLEDALDEDSDRELIAAYLD